MRHPAVSQLGQVRLEPGFGQRLFEQTIVAAMQGNRMIPDFRRGIDSAMEVFKPFATKKLELKGLTHRYNSMFT
jgi:hypothetical protein